jgi:hypothetical protein
MTAGSARRVAGTNRSPVVGRHEASEGVGRAPHLKVVTYRRNEVYTNDASCWMIPQFLDLEKLTASHRHGMLRLTLPLKESVKPRRVQIETQVEDQKQLTGVR